MTGPTGTRPLNEVRAAWVALESGAFAQPRMDWGAFGVDVAVVGAHGGAGATTVALALVSMARASRGPSTTTAVAPGLTGPVVYRLLVL